MTVADVFKNPTFADMARVSFREKPIVATLTFARLCV